MAATGYTPISLYYSTTASAVPVNTNLVAGELALNTLDEKLYFKNSAGTVKLLAASAAATGTVSSVAQSFTGGIISVSGSPITTSGTLALTVAGTSGGIPYFSSASTWATSAALASNALMVGGGAGASPSTVTTGTGVVTALGVNTGTAGAFVVNGGALGTPSSGTLTNCTFPTLNQNTSGTASNVTGTVAVANGGTGSTTLTANNVLLGNGTSALQVVAPGTSGNVLTSNGTTWTSAAGGGFGVGQTLTNYSSSGRAMGTTYTNSTGKPIAVMFTPVASGSLFCAALIDGNVVEYTQFTPSGGGGCSAFFIMVPNSSTYQMRNDGNASIGYWYEWR